MPRAVLDEILIASALGFPDALPGAVEAPLLLARTACVPAPSPTALQRLAPEEVLLLGGAPTLKLGGGRVQPALRR